MTGTCECGKPARAKGMCKTCYNKNLRITNPEYARKAREYSKEYYKKKYHKNHPEAKYRGNSIVCEIIKQHHEEMKDDPEHLTTEFIKSLIHVNCREEDK